MVHGLCRRKSFTERTHPLVPHGTHREQVRRKAGLLITLEGILPHARNIALLALSLCASLSAQAGELMDMWQAALEHNAANAATRAQGETDAAKRDEASALYRPEASLGAGARLWHVRAFHLLLSLRGSGLRQLRRCVLLYAQRLCARIRLVARRSA